MSLFHFPFSKKRADRNAEEATLDTESMLCGKMNFAAKEAYKLLRTNIMFSFADENDCRVIGVSSALRGEGKSVTSINTAYSLAQLGKKVLLIDADFRIPSIAKKMNLRKSPGLSNLLVGMNKFSDTIQHYTSVQDDVTFDIMVAGDIPPNPSELLGSERMKALIALLMQTYNYILIDLPPIVPVSDALVVSKLTHGMLVVVRQDYCQRAMLNDVVQQLEFVNANILGFVFNAASDSGSGYGSHYGKTYQKNYRTPYGYSREKAGSASERSTSS